MNQDGQGNLRGYAYSANVGLINFESTGAPKVDLVSGNLSGYVWDANISWISLSNVVAYVKSDTIQRNWRQSWMQAAPMSLSDRYWLREYAPPCVVEIAVYSSGTMWIYSNNSLL